jgi:hypothetical protein
MTRGAKTKAGKKPCPVCGETVYVQTNAAGTVSLKCHECDVSLFAKAGTVAARKLTDGLAAAPAAPLGKVPKAPVAKPRDAQPSGSAPLGNEPKGFSLGSL